MTLKVMLLSKGPAEALTGLLAGCEVDIVEDGESALVRLLGGGYDLVVLECRTDLVRYMAEADPRVDIFIIAEGGLPALEAIKQGATDCFSLPLDSERFKESLGAVSEQVRVRNETDNIEKLLVEKYTFAGVVARNPQMLDIFRFLRKVAPYYRVATINGETGTGKEAMARALHSISPVSAEPFIACNCGAMVEGLVESEFFGHLKGAFTGADSDKKGLFEAAGVGVLFLDEIGDLPLSFQPSLLRVLQDGEFRKVGSTRAEKAGCRVIAATNRDLAGEVRTGRFREDLYYRLTPLTMTVPPLRERKDDITLLCRFIIGKFSSRTGKRVHGVSRQAQKTLLSYDWPGNVRELENAVEYAAILASEPYIKPEHLPEWITTAASAPEAPVTLDVLIKGHIESALKRCGGNRTEAAKALGISRRALLRKIERYSLS